ncbi:MAG: CRISPR-associated protein Csx15 [Chloroflexi bacterium]|nr:CRISPR-associated protein Csx15 [Chloroflexota bacterium]MCI0580855.1 CRISPR-associated protein Csx15 [Chloroflexota bacterium]
MLLLNFSHPLTPEQLVTVRAIVGQEPIEVHEVKTQFDHEQSFVEQILELVNSLNFPAPVWQTESMLINPPSHNVIATVLLAELHGRMGYFPAVLRLKPVPDSTPPRFEIAEVINLQKVRDQARTRR